MMVMLWRAWWLPKLSGEIGKNLAYDSSAVWGGEILSKPLGSGDSATGFKSNEIRINFKTTLYLVTIS